MILSNISSGRALRRSTSSGGEMGSATGGAEMGATGLGFFRPLTMDPLFLFILQQIACMRMEYIETSSIVLVKTMEEKGRNRADLTMMIMMHPLVICHRCPPAWTLTNRMVDIILLMARLSLLVRVLAIFLQVSSQLLLLIQILKLHVECKLSKKSGLGRLGSFLLL
jgi:hypothetical protein